MRETFGDLARAAAAAGNPAMEELLLVAGKDSHSDTQEMIHFYDLKRIVSRKQVGWLATNQSGEVEFSQDKQCAVEAVGGEQYLTSLQKVYV